MSPFAEPKKFQFWNSYCENLRVSRVKSSELAVSSYHGPKGSLVSAHRPQSKRLFTVTLSVADIVQASHGIKTKQKQRAITL